MEKREGFFGRFFGISQSGSNMRTEILAGITTFITVAYILILNPQILADPFVITGDMAMAAKVSNGVFIGTCIGAFIGTFLCALYCDHSGRIASGYHPGNTGSNQNSDHTGNRAFYHDHWTEKCRHCSEQSGHFGKYGRLCTVEKR